MNQNIEPPQDLQRLSDELHRALNLKHDAVDGNIDSLKRVASHVNSGSNTHRLINLVTEAQRSKDQLTGFYHCFAIVKDFLNLPEPSTGDES